MVLLAQACQQEAACHVDVYLLSQSQGRCEDEEDKRGWGTGQNIDEGEKDKESWQFVETVITEDLKLIHCAEKCAKEVIAWQSCMEVVLRGLRVRCKKPCGFCLSSQPTYCPPFLCCWFKCDLLLCRLILIILSCWCVQSHPLLLICRFDSTHLLGSSDSNFLLISPHTSDCCIVYVVSSFCLNFVAHLSQTFASNLKFICQCQ